MSKALEILGYNTVYHGFDLFNRSRDIEMWIDGIRAKYFRSGTTVKPFNSVELDMLLGDCRACTDSPPCFFAEELIEAYPDAKIILVQRDFESWFKSFSDGCLQNFDSPLRDFTARFDRKYYLMRTMNKLVLKGKFQGSTADEIASKAEAVYNDHYDIIRARSPKEKVLNFSLKDGWEPLCAFLGKPIPSCPFPRVNEANTFKEKRELIFQRSVWSLLRDAALVGGLAATLVYMYRFRSIVRNLFRL